MLSSCLCNFKKRSDVREALKDQRSTFEDVCRQLLLYNGQHGRICVRTLKIQKTVHRNGYRNQEGTS